MKKLLAILMPSLLITTGINNIKLNNSNDVATVQKITTKSNIKNSNVYAGYTNAENTIIDILNHGVSNYSYLTITTMIEAEIYGFNIKTDKNYVKELNDKFNSKIEKFLVYIWSISYILLPTDKTYIRVYLNIAYHYMPLYFMFPYMYNQILRNKVLTSKQKTNLTALVTLLRKNDGNFNTGYHTIYGVNDFFENNMLHVGNYDKTLDTLATFNPDNLNCKAQYVAAGWGYYGFHLFYNETTKKSYVYYKGNPMWKYNMGSIV